MNFIDLKDENQMKSGDYGLNDIIVYILLIKSSQIV